MNDGAGYPAAHLPHATWSRNDDAIGALMLGGGGSVAVRLAQPATHRPRSVLQVSSFREEMREEGADLQGYHSFESIYLRDAG